MCISARRPGTHWRRRCGRGRSSCSSSSTGSAAIQPLRRAKRITLERRERARRGLGRAATAPQLLQQVGDVVDRERGDPPPPERR
jgi:hypothetical protein